MILENNNAIFGSISADLPMLEEAEVWLREIRRGLAAEKKKAGVKGKREEEERGEQAGWVEEEGRGYK